MHAHLRWLLLLTVALGGCQTIGPGSVQRDRLDYGDAIAGSWREQMLLNIVKLRYFDTPVFLEVSSVISSYTLQSEIDLALRIFPNGQSNSYRNFGATGTYTDRPTITYTPITGEKYIDKLLRPIPPQAIFAMIQAGHPADFILALTVRAINDVYNASVGPARTKREDPAFRRVVEAFQRVQQAGALSVRTERRGGAEATLIFFHDRPGAEVEKDIRFLRQTLEIDPNAKEILLTFGAARRGGGEIALLTRSIWEILATLSAGVDVPERDAAEGRATAVPRPDGRPGVLPIARIHSSSEPQPGAYAAVRYRDHWFWIDDRDLGSKRVFTFLMVFSSIAETGAMPHVPIITIPAN